MKLRRFLAAAMTAVMLLATVPSTMFAANGGGNADSEGKLFLDKTATLTGDGSYTIDMEAYATGLNNKHTDIKGVPLDIVLVLDQSGSMADNKLTMNGNEVTYQEALKSTVNTFIQSVVENGKTAKVTHRMAMVGFASGPLEGSDWSWTNTGVFNNQGKLVAYQKANETTTTHKEYNGELVQGSSYFVKVGNEFVPLTYNKAADKYVVVTNPATDRTDLYGQVNGKYEKAAYGEYTATEQAANPKKGDGKTYYDAKGNQLTWVEETKSDYVKVTSGNFQGTEYYIDTNKDPKNPNWVKLTWKGIGWDSTDSKIYVKQEPKNGIYQFKRRKNYYDAYTMENKPTGNWILSADGKTPTTAYEKVTKSGWNVNGTPVDPVYEKVKGAGEWQYQEKGKPVVWTPAKQVYVKTVSSTFASALVPVTDGVNGQGETTQSLIDAKNNIQASGATRPSLGVDMANQIFEGNPIPAGENRKRVMIVFTDGEPGYHGYDEVEAWKSITESYKTKHTYGATVYSIGLYNRTPGTDVKNFLSYISSDYPDAKYDYQKLSSKPSKGNFIMRYENDDALANSEDGYRRVGGGKDNKDSWNNFPKSGVTYYKYDTKLFTPGTKANPATFSKTVTTADELSKMFEEITENIGGITSSVKLDAKSIMRDIMADGFELTPASKVIVSVVPGSVPADQKIPANQLTKDKITWENPVPVLTLTPCTDKATDSGSYNGMTIKATTYTQNPEAGKKDLHTVDVTGFNYSTQFIAAEHPGSMLKVQVTGVKALPTVTTDAKTLTNNEQSGIWSPLTDGNRKLEAAFPKPDTYMPSKSYVVDYAKPLDLAISDLKMKTAQNIDKDGYNPFASANTAITEQYGKVDLAASKLTYAPKTMNWDGYDTFYVFGTTADETVKAASANNNGNVWGKVNVIPANNVYYEDSFVSTKGLNGTVGITYTGAWSEIKGTDSNTNGSAAEDATNSFENHGWIPVLNNEVKGDTDGSSHHASGEGNSATAKFTFTGTGVDVYSRTNGQTGTIMAMLMDSKNNIISVKIVDTKSASGEYYQVPTLTFHEKNDDQGKLMDLPYGTYTVELTVTNQVKDRLDYYLDGIRVYNPIKTDDTTVQNAYGPDELNSTFKEVRNILLDNNSFTADQPTANGPVFIDEVQKGQAENPNTPTTTTVVGTYKDYGPKNEVYLAKNQSISFKVDTSKGCKFQVGLKALKGDVLNVALTKDGTKKVSGLSHTADLYYDITPGTDGIIHIKNLSEGLLAVTKIKVTNENGSVNLADVFVPVQTTELLASARTFSMAPVPGPDVEIPDPQPPVEPEQPSKPSIEDILNDIFGGIFGWN